MIQQRAKLLHFCRIFFGSSWPGILFCSFFTVAYISLVLNRFWQLEYFAIDNVYFDRAMFLMSQGQAPMVRHPFLGTINIFADHFHPVILFISVLYKFIPKQEAVLTLMCTLYGISAYLGLQIGLKLLSSRILAYALTLSYFLYLGTQNAMIFGFHELHFVPLFFMAAVYALLFCKTRWYFFWVALLLLTKESMAILVTTLGIFTAVSLPAKRKVGFVTIGLAIFYFLLVTRVVMPYIGGKEFLYGGNEVDTPNNLFDLYSALTKPPEKVWTAFVSFATFGFLPLLSFGIILPLQDLLVRFIFSLSGNVQYTLGYHYGVATAPLLFFASIWSARVWQAVIARFLQSRSFLSTSFGDHRKTVVTIVPYVVAGVVIAMSLVLTRFTHPRGPILLSFNPAFYATTVSNAFLWELIDAVPNASVIMAQNHLGYTLTHKGNVYQMGTDKTDIKFEEANPDYIVYDLREGQNPNNYFPLDYPKTRNYTQRLINEGRYKVYWNRGSMFILRKTPQ